DNLAVLMGGRAAEELVLDELTTGAGNDIDRATETARKMVCEWGMSEELGPLSFGQKEEQIFLGREFAQHRDYSEKTAVVIDKEISNLVSGAHQRARKILEENMDTLHALAQALLEKETLTEKDIDAIIAGNVHAASESTEEKAEPEAQGEGKGQATPQLRPLPS
ncbi:MAG: cell division protein FtsH, partial [Thermodesulfobacteriota bacterium]|nr:cell division protein FtsH [Thermodesulfobacteriota bacterium]